MNQNPFYSKIDLTMKPLKGVEVITFQKPVDGKYKPLSLINELVPYESITSSLSYATHTQRPYLFVRRLAFGIFGYIEYGTSTLAELRTALTATKTSYYTKEMIDKLLVRRADMDGVNPKKYHALDFSKNDIFTAEWCYQYDIANLLAFVENYKSERGFVSEYGKFNKPDIDMYDVLDEPDIREVVFRAVKHLKNEFVSDPLSFKRLMKYGHKYTYMTAQQFIPGAVGVINSRFKSAITKANITASRNAMSYTISTGTEANLKTPAGGITQLGSSEIWKELYNGDFTVADLVTAVNACITAVQDSPSHELIRSYYRGLTDAANRNYDMPAEFVSDTDETPIGKDLAVVNKLKYLPQVNYVEASDDFRTDGYYCKDGISLEYGAYAPEISYEEIIERGIFELVTGAPALYVASFQTKDVVYGDYLCEGPRSQLESFSTVNSGNNHVTYATPNLLSVADITAGTLFRTSEIMRTFGLPYLIGFTNPSVGPDDTPFRLENLRSNQHLAVFNYDQATSWIMRTVEEFNGGY